MHVQVKEQLLVIFTFKGFNYMNIDPWKRVLKTPDHPVLNRAPLRSDVNDNKTALKVCNLNLAAEI